MTPTERETLKNLQERISPDELAKQGFPRPKKVLLSKRHNYDGEEALYVFLVFPNNTPEKALAWKKIEPMVSWVRSLILAEVDGWLWPYVKVKLQKQLPGGTPLVPRIGRDLIAQARMLALRERGRPKQPGRSDGDG